jgi:hypothetical protein
MSVLISPTQTQVFVYIALWRQRTVSLAHRGSPVSGPTGLDIQSSNIAVPFETEHLLALATDSGALW